MPSDFHTQTRLVTRKDQPCLWCREVIPKKSPVLHVAGKSEGEFYHGHFHPECEKAWESIEGDYWTPGYMVRGKAEER